MLVFQKILILYIAYILLTTAALTETNHTSRINDLVRNLFENL